MTEYLVVKDSNTLFLGTSKDDMKEIIVQDGIIVLGAGSNQQFAGIMVQDNVLYFGSCSYAAAYEASKVLLDDFTALAVIDTAYGWDILSANGYVTIGFTDNLKNHKLLRITTTGDNGFICDSNHIQIYTVPIDTNITKTHIISLADVNTMVITGSRHIDGASVGFLSVVELLSNDNVAVRSDIVKKHFNGEFCARLNFTSNISIPGYIGIAAIGVDEEILGYWVLDLLTGECMDPTAEMSKIGGCIQ